MICIYMLVYQIYTKFAFCFCHYQHTARYAIVCTLVLEKLKQHLCFQLSTRHPGRYDKYAQTPSTSQIGRDFFSCIRHLSKFSVLAMHTCIFAFYVDSIVTSGRDRCQVRPVSHSIRPSHLCATKVIN